MAKRGRKSLYESNVLPNLEKIKQWLLFKKTDEFIAENLLIGYSTWMAYKAEKKELIEILEEAPKIRANYVDDIKKSLFDRAKGFEYEETKTVYIPNEKGKPVIHKREVYKKRALGDTAAAKEILELFDEDYVGRKANHELKIQELEWKKEQSRIEKEWEPVEDGEE